MSFEHPKPELYSYNLKEEYAETNTSYYCVYQPTASGAPSGFLWGKSGQRGF